jgi:hypothetical protein
MTDERLKEIEEDAIVGKLPDALTVQALVCCIRIGDRTIQEQSAIIRSLRKSLNPVQGAAILGAIITRTP